MKKKALVIGGSGSIGTALVHQFLEIGWDVAVMSRHSRSGLEIGSSGQVATYQGDVTNEADLDRIGREFAASGHLDCIVYSAGLPPDVTIPLKEYPAAKWDETFSTYVTGCLFSFRALLPYVQRGAHLIVLGSAITRFASDSLPPIHAGHYAAAKAAVSELVKWMRREAKEQGLSVSLVSPSAVDTASHQTGELAAVPKKLIPVTALCSAILGIVSAGIDSDLQMLA